MYCISYVSGEPMDIQAAVDRLNSQLPLKARQDQLSPELKAVHQKVLSSLVRQGLPPTFDDLKAMLSDGNIEGGLQRLGKDDLVVLDAEGKLPVGAYPVTIENTPHKITVSGHTIHAMCALDAVSVAPMFEAEVRIESTCRVTNTPIKILMLGSHIIEVLPTDDVIVGVRWQMPSGVAAHSMCLEMVFLKDRQTAEKWQNGDIENVSLFSLSEAVEFGKKFFLPLMD